MKQIISLNSDTRFAAPYYSLVKGEKLSPPEVFILLGLGVFLMKRAYSFPLVAWTLLLCLLGRALTLDENARRIRVGDWLAMAQAISQTQQMGLESIILLM